MNSKCNNTSTGGERKESVALSYTSQDPAVLPCLTLSVQGDEVDVGHLKGQQERLEGQTLDSLVRLVAHRLCKVVYRLHQHVLGAVTNI